MISLCAVLLLPGAATAALDQHQDDTSDCANQVDPYNQQAQIFTAGMTGALTEVDLALTGVETPDLASAILEIWITGVVPVDSNGVSVDVPDQPLAIADVPASTINSSGFTNVAIGPVPVISGTKYAIVVGAPGSLPPLYENLPGLGVTWLGSASANAYPGGQRAYKFLRGIASVAWFLSPDATSCDFAFRTFVTRSVAARLRSLTATRSRHGMLVRWRTASEVNVAGFNVYRTWHGRRARLNPRLIVAAGTTVGHAYRYLDRTRARPGARYWLQSVDLDGSFNWFGPVSVPAS